MSPPRLPTIGEYVRRIGRLVAIEDVPPPEPPPPPARDYIFEQITARCEIRRNGEVLKHIQTLTDCYGLETGVKAAISEMQQYAIDHAYGPQSEAEVVVVRVAEQIRHRPCSGENFGAKDIVNFHYLTRGAHWNLPDPVETIAWSSKHE